MTTDTVLVKAIERIVEQFDPVKIILFGSRARGTATEMSDYDFIVLHEDFEDRWDLAMEMNRTVSDLMIPCDILVYTPEEFQQRRRFCGSVARYASREGRVLYEHAA